MTEKEEYLSSKDCYIKGVKSFNRNTWIDIARESNALEGIFDDFSFDLIDFRAQLRGKIASDPSTKDFDLNSYFYKLLEQEKHISEENDSIIVIGRNKEYKLSLETARHFVAYKYVYMCAKQYNKLELLKAQDYKNIIQNAACLLAGVDAVPFRKIQVYVNKNGNYDLANWTPIKPTRLSSQFDSLCEWLEKANGMHPIEKAAIGMTEFIRIHPYLDGNGRVGRILANFILMRNDIPTIQIRHQNTIEHFKAVNKAIETHDCVDLIKMFKEAVFDSVKKTEECLNFIEKKNQSKDNKEKKNPSKDDKSKIVTK